MRYFSILSIIWAIFQLVISDLFLIDSLMQRSIHLGFGLSLAYLLVQKKDSCKNLFISLTLLFLPLYLSFFEESLSKRMGNFYLIDIIWGCSLLLILLEISRRVIGTLIGLIAIAFMVICLFASNLPETIAFRDVSFSHLITRLTFSTEGVYGIPLRISADTIFLFVLFGALLEASEGAPLFIQMALSLMGRFKGGAAKAAILASSVTGMVSGSSIANTVTTGTLTIPLMKKSGYPCEKAAAIEVAASTNGQLMPPIMGASAFIIAEYCALSYETVVIAALMPALLAYLSLFFITHIEAYKHDIAIVKETKSFFPLFKSSLFFWIPLSILIYSLMIWRLSAAKSAYFAILVLMIITLIREIINKKRIWQGIQSTLVIFQKSTIQACKNMVPITIATATSGMIIGLISLGLGSKMTELIQLFSFGSLLGVLIISAILSLILGMGLPTTATYIVVANITAPAIIEINPEIPLIAAHLFCFYFGILADDTPPVGLAAFAAAAIAGSKPVLTAIQAFLYDIRAAILPFLFIYNPKILSINLSNTQEGIILFSLIFIGLMSLIALSQNFLIQKNRWFENILFCLASLLIFFSQELSIYTYLGIALFLVGYLLQKQNQKTAKIKKLV